MSARNRRLTPAGGHKVQHGDGGGRRLHTDVGHRGLPAGHHRRQVNERLLAAQGGGGRPVEFATMRWARNDLAEFFLVPKG